MAEHMEPSPSTGTDLHPQVVAAIIAAVVSTLAALLTLLASRWQLRAKMLELDLKKSELENMAAKLKADVEALRQTAMRDVLVKRMEAYAELWRVFITYERNWWLEQKVFDDQWASTFVSSLNSCNAKHGVFFSQKVYDQFYEYRARLLKLQARARSGDVISHDDILTLVEVSTQGTPEKKSMATAMKDELGSYIRLVTEFS